MNRMDGGENDPSRLTDDAESVRMSETDEIVTTRVSEEGETAIPEEIRDHLGVEAGDEVAWTTDDGCAVVRRRETTKGIFLDDDVSDEEREAILQEAVERAETRPDWDGPDGDEL